MVIVTLGYIPAEKIEETDQIPARNIKYMQLHGLIEPGDKVLFFYSDNFFSREKDGNGLTERQVFSYWRDKDNKIYTDAVEYDRIYDMKTSINSEENIVVELFFDEDDSMILYVAGDDDLTDVFIETLRQRIEN